MEQNFVVTNTVIYQYLLAVFIEQINVNTGTMINLLVNESVQKIFHTTIQQSIMRFLTLS